MGLRNRTEINNYSQIFFITTSVYDKTNIYNIGEIYCNILLDSLKFCLKKYDAELVAYVIMPNHIHLVINFLNSSTPSDLMRDFKKYTSTQIRIQLERDGFSNIVEKLRKNSSGARNQVFKLWQDRFDDLAINNEKTLIQKIEYIHNNPVKRGLVKEPSEWKYSSYTYYYGEGNGIIDIKRII